MRSGTPSSPNRRDMKLPPAESTLAIASSAALATGTCGDCSIALTPGHASTTEGSRRGSSAWSVAPSASTRSSGGSGLNWSSASSDAMLCSTDIASSTRASASRHVPKACRAFSCTTASPVVRVRSCESGKAASRADEASRNAITQRAHRFGAEAAARNALVSVHGRCCAGGLLLEIPSASKSSSSSESASPMVGV